MIGAIWNGYIGLSTFDKAIATESNNVSNTTTVGNKLDSVSFEDMFYSPRGFGNGVSIQNVTKIFTQGELGITNVSSDVAIEGKGFFIVEDTINNKNYYTRAGNFQKNSESFLETQENMLVKGLSPQDKQIISTNSEISEFNNEYSKFVTSIDIKNGNVLYNINARTTDYFDSALDDNLELSGNNYKTASSKIVDLELLNADFIEKLNLFESDPNVESIASTTQITSVNFNNDTSQLIDENDYVRIVIDGVTYNQNFTGDVEETLNLLSDKISNSEGFTSVFDNVNNTITIENILPGNEFSLTEAKINEQFSYVNYLQEAKIGSGLAMVESSRNAFIQSVERAGAEYLEITNILTTEDIDNLTLDNIQLNLNTLGLFENSFGNLEIDTDGYVYLIEDNNKFLVSKIQTAGFTNEQGLNPLGSNIFAATDESGEAFNADSLNTIRPNFLERGNTSYSDSLSTLLVYQKAFEANSKSVTISDEFVKTAIDMKK